MDRFTISLDEQLAAAFDQWLGERGYTTRSEAVRDLLRAELERARAVWLRRFGDSPPQDARQWARQMRFLVARGFAGDVVRRVVPDAPR